jgi:uncharacterized membrane protein YqjE
LAVSPDKLPREDRPGGPEADGTSAIAQSLQEISERAQVLVREEIELAKSELQIKAKSLGVGVGVGVAAGTFAAIALLFILIGFAWLAWYLLPNDTPTYFWGFFIVAAILLVIAAIAGFVAYRALKKGTPPQPTMAIEEAKRIRETVTSDQPGRTV